MEMGQQRPFLLMCLSDPAEIGHDACVHTRARVRAGIYLFGSTADDFRALHSEMFYRLPSETATRIR